VSGVLKHIPKENWKQEIEQGLFETEGGRKLTSEEKVKAGERLFHVLPKAAEPAVSPEIKIIHEDEAIIGVYKPAPLPVIASGRFQRNTLQFLLNEVYKPQFPRPVHRLDANTSGINIFAKTKTFAAFLHKQFEEKTVQKKYLVKVHGFPLETEFVCIEPIASEPTDVGARILDPQGLEAETHFRVLKRFDENSALLEARPITGRTNQIRVHLWALGFPVWGDPLYLKKKKLGKIQTLGVNDPPMCLHAWEITLCHPLTKKSFRLQTEMPQWAKI
jgi:RluA family pseudouridine synthase